MDEDFLLVQKMRMGDEKAFESFVTKYYPAILKYCQIHICERKGRIPERSGCSCLSFHRPSSCSPC